MRKFGDIYGKDTYLLRIFFLSMLTVPATVIATIDLSLDNTLRGDWRSSASTIKFMPTNQSISFNKTQQLIQFNSLFAADTAESALAINATSSTGFAKEYANSTLYVTGDFLSVNESLYRVIRGGTSAGSGAGPTGTGSSINDGSMTVAYQCSDQCNGKFPFFVSHKAKSGAGHVWGGALDLVLDAGYRGGFATSLEIDMTNNSGGPQPMTNALFLTGITGSNPIQNGLSIYSGSGSKYWSKTAINIFGDRVAEDQAVYIKSGSNFGILDEGNHMNGIVLNGSYSGPALKTTGEIEASSYRSGGKSGATCPAGTVNLATLEVINGIITHC